MTRRTNSNLVEAFGADGGPAALDHFGLAVVCSLHVAGGVRVLCTVRCVPPIVRCFSHSRFSSFSQPLKLEVIKDGPHTQCWLEASEML